MTIKEIEQRKKIQEEKKAESNKMKSLKEKAINPEKLKERIQELEKKGVPPAIAIEKAVKDLAKKR